MTMVEELEFTVYYNGSTVAPIDRSVFYVVATKTTTPMIPIILSTTPTETT